MEKEAGDQKLRLKQMHVYAPSQGLSTLEYFPPHCWHTSLAVDRCGNHATGIVGKKMGPGFTLPANVGHHVTYLVPLHVLFFHL